jgi:signal transduction histidine kinase
LGLLAGIACMLIALGDTGMDWDERGTILGILAFNAACLAYLRLGKATPRFGQVVSFGFAAAIVAFAVLQRDQGWPPSVAAVPILVVFSTLVAGPATSLAIILFAVATISVAYLSPSSTPRPYVASNLFTWAMPTLMLHVLLWRLSRVLDLGVRELSTSTLALWEIRKTTVQLTHILTVRIAGAVNELSRVAATVPTGIAEPARKLSRMLAEARAQAPREPDLPATSLSERLLRLRTAAIDTTFLVVGLASLIGFVQVLYFSPPEMAVRVLVQMGTMLALVAVRIARPRWRRGLMLACMLAFAAQLPGFLFHWHAIAPLSAPNLTIVIMSSILATVTVHPAMGWLILAEFSAITLFILRAYPGAPWAIPIAMASASAVLCWVVAHWPSRLLHLLQVRHAEAFHSLRAQRRMMATLFHDLTNPLQVLMNADPGLLSDAETTHLARTYTGRLRDILAASQRGHSVRSNREAHVLFDDLIAMFRSRVDEKKLRLTLVCPPAICIACDESHLRDSVLANLLSNAIKFSSPGGAIDLCVEESSGRAIVRIEDRGPGLPEDVRAALGQERRAPSHSGTAGESGSGYGLLLAREYLEAMGGSLELSPRDGGGLAARLELPLAARGGDPASQGTFSGVYGAP